MPKLGGVDTMGGGSGESRKDKFPLNRGSKGANVRRLQRALLSKDKNALPKFGVDGDFGSETATAALKIIGKATDITEADVIKLENQTGTKPPPVPPTPAPTANVSERIKSANRLKDEWWVNRNTFKMLGQKGYLLNKDATQIALYKNSISQNNFRRTVAIVANSKFVDLKFVDKINVASDGFLEIYLTQNFSNQDANILRVSPAGISILREK
jgi:hypothetical protein